MQEDDFPYKKRFLDKDELWENCKRLDLVVVSNTAPRWHTIPREFRWKNLTFIVKTDAYKKVDVLTDYFTEEARMRAKRKGHMSPHEYFMRNKAKIRAAAEEVKAYSDPWDSKDISEAQRDAATIPLDHLMREEIYKSIPEATTFKISLTKAIVGYFGAKRGTSSADPSFRVLDPSAGWGDRLIGAAALGVSYTGVDPNVDVRYDEIIRGLNLDRERYRVISSGFLEVSDEELLGPFDMVFTSPPFFDYEVYVADDKPSAARQSIHGKKDLAGWEADFFHPYLRKAWNLLAPGGHFAIYISDTRSGNYCKNMVEVMKELGADFFGPVGTCNEDNMTRGFPVWVWKKK